MKCKKIISRRTGSILNKEDAIRLCYKLRQNYGIEFIEHKSVYGYPTPDMAEKANLQAVMETYEGYTFAFAGTEYGGFEGYKVYVVAIKQLPLNFETLCPDYVVIG